MIDAPVNPTFLANLRALWRTDPRLAQRIDELPLDASLALHPTRTNCQTASVSTADGRTLFLHSRYDPIREATDFIKGLDRTEARCVILCGLGLGYHIQPIFDILGEELVILVSEPDLVTIKTALEHTDLSAGIAAGRIEFLTTPAKAALHERLVRHSTMLMLGAVIAVPPVARDHQAPAHAIIRQAVLDFAAFAKMSLVTLVKNAGITARNVANNLPVYASTPPPDVLRGRFTGCPAILVAAGPSLAKNIDQLAALRDRAVIIAAQTTLKPLLERGIKPHFVTSLDWSDLSRQFFDGVAIPDDVILVAEPKASWHVVDAFRGDTSAATKRVILLHNPFAQRCVGDVLPPRSPMDAGATVMHLAFYLAQWLGCDPIVFIGQDLAFGGHVYYAPGVAIHRAWDSELGRFGTLEMKEWERIARHRPILRKVPGHDGREIYTDEQMFTYLEQFERDFARCAARVIDATEGGARKQGAQAMSLSEAASAHLQAVIAAARFDFADVRWQDRSRLEAARDTLRRRREELAEFRALCDRTRELLHALESLTHDAKAFNRKIAEVDELRTLVQEHELIFAMVRDVSQLGELQRFAADRRLAESDDRGRDRAVQQLRRDGQFISSLLEGCDTLASIFDQALARFDAESNCTVSTATHQPTERGAS